MQCVKATFINFLLKPKQLFGLPQVFKLSHYKFVLFPGLPNDAA